MDVAATTSNSTTEFVHLMRSSWTAAIDLGQVNDFTAVAVVQRLRHFSTEPLIPGGRLKPGLVSLPAQLGEAKPRDQLRIRALKRLPLGLSYVEQAQQLAVLLADPVLSGAETFVDATGCGLPVCDILTAAGVRHTPIVITGGSEVVQRDRGYAVSKLLLVSRLQASFHAGELRIPRELPEAKNFVHELQEFRATLSEAGCLRFGARATSHDDMILAVAIAVFGATSLRHECTVAPLSFGGRGTY